MVLSDTSIKRPVFATVISLLLIVLGLASFQRLPIRELPDIDPPEVCRSRSSLSVEAFQRWFDLTANCLAGLLGESILPMRQALARL